MVCDEIVRARAMHTSPSVNSSSLPTVDLPATVRMSGAEAPELARTERSIEPAIGGLRRRPAGTQPPPVAASLDVRSEATDSALACAKEAHDDLFAHRRGIWDCGDGVSCLFDNDPDAHGELEIETLRTLLSEAGCTQVGVATYPAAGHEDGTYTLAVLVRGDARTILSVYEAVDRELDASRAAR
jgi:hypothetical protein